MIDGIITLTRAATTATSAGSKQQPNAAGFGGGGGGGSPPPSLPMLLASSSSKTTMTQPPTSAATTTTTTTMLLATSSISDSSSTTTSPSVSLAWDGHSSPQAARQRQQPQQERPSAVGLDQRGPFDHLLPSQLVKGAIRVCIQQSATIFSHYMSDQLKEDMARDEKVQRGELSLAQAETLADEWGEKEWTKRWETFPAKFWNAYVKYHAATAIMRLYEQVSARRVTVERMDELTRDPFAAARRRETRGERPSISAVAKECWDANMIAYLADYSVHQIILAFGYYVYIRDRQQRRQQRRKNDADGNSNSSAPTSTSTTKKGEDTKDGSADSNKDKDEDDSKTGEKEDNDNNNNDNDDDSVELHAGSLALSLLKKSTILALSRLVCLAFASVGGAVGTMILPGGWGTLAGINMGDGLGIQVTEEFVLTATTAATTTTTTT